MVDYECPFCGAGYEDPDYWEVPPEEKYNVECDECGETFQVSYCLDPVFLVWVDEEVQ